MRVITRGAIAFLNVFALSSLYGKCAITPIPKRKSKIVHQNAQRAITSICAVLSKRSCDMGCSSRCTVHIVVVDERVVFAIFDDQNAKMKNDTQ